MTLFPHFSVPIKISQLAFLIALLKEIIMQTIEIENTVNLSILPENAQQELIDFYQFLVEKYTKKQKSAKPHTLQKHTPITQSLIGILQNNSVNERDYKQHLEDKYL